jgi:hypothetical protein
MCAESSRFKEAQSFMDAGIFFCGAGAFALPLPGVKDLAAPMLSTPPSVVGLEPSPLERGLGVAMVPCSC